MSVLSASIFRIISCRVDALSEVIPYPTSLLAEGRGLAALIHDNRVFYRNRAFKIFDCGIELNFQVWITD